MCGIAGIIDFSKDHRDRGIVDNMIDVMRHRGPDGEGLHQSEHCVFGHVRLSIIDVEGSHQPLCNEDETIWITYNGEIYNYPSLREDLIHKGHVFRTKGDTEVLVHLYEEYGEQMATHLNGMFAFAIWDKRKEQLFLARDRMGIKPMYFVHRDNMLLFASEPKALLQHPAVQARLNPEGLWHYLTYRSVPAPATLFEGVNKLLPGHYAAFSRHGLRLTEYWDIQPGSDTCLPNLTDGQALSWVEDAFTRSVTRQMISDVPLGAFLSGGVDSSLIVAMMSRVGAGPVKTYSVGFDDYPFSEIPYARTVAGQYHTDHHELILKEEVFADYMEKLVWIRDAPLSEPADIPLHLLAKMASRDVKVLLSGEGSDELFGGYPKSAYDRFSKVVGLLPRRAVMALTDRLPARCRRLETAFRSLIEQDDAIRWAQWFAPFTGPEKARLMPGARQYGLPTASYVRRKQLDGSLASMLYCDCKIWLPDNLLDRGDRMTMGASVETRVPYLDNEMVDLAFSLPARVKVRGFERKWVIKQIAARFLPRDIVFRPKVGFKVPLARWFRGKLKDLCYDRICDSRGLVREVLSEVETRKILDDHCSGKKDNDLKIWTLLGLSLWHQVFVAKRTPTT